MRFTAKALFELAALGLDEEDAVDVLTQLSATESVGRIRSEVTGEWMYVFKPVIGAQVVYLKVIVRLHCLVISFHDDEHRDDEEE